MSFTVDLRRSKTRVEELVNEKDSNDEKLLVLPDDLVHGMELKIEVLEDQVSGLTLMTKSGIRRLWNGFCWTRNVTWKEFRGV